MTEQANVKTCPFPECEWSKAYDPDGDLEEMYAEHFAELHYEREHAGKVKVQLTIEKEVQIGPRTPKDVREHYLDDFEPSPGWDIAHVRTEVVREADNHEVLNNE